MSTLTETHWGLEVVRGKGVGRCYPLGRGRSVLGNALDGAPGIDLGGEEGASPRRMAGRQAEIAADAQALSVRDLDSPGGTFVNSQRVLPGQARALRDGDVLQLAGVQLRVVARLPAPVSPASIGPLPRPYHTASGTTCRTWDDFPTASAKDWSGLRDELISGRITTFLKSIGRDDLLPTAPASRTEDERLDAWLGRLPVARPLEADLDVHPSVLHIKANLPGTTRRSVSITNTGYRLLRSTLTIEPPGTDWLRIAPPFDRGAFTTAESTEFSVEATIPETLTSPRVASVVVASNGGSRTVAVHLEPPAKDAPEPLRAPVPTTRLADPLGAIAPTARVMQAIGLGLLVRVLLSVGDQFVSPATSPGLEGAGMLFAGLGAIVGLLLAIRGSGVRDAFPGAFAGAVVGLFTAAVAVATCRSVEPLFGIDRSWTAWGFWVLASAALALLSLWVRPYPSAESGASS